MSFGQQKYYRKELSKALPRFFSNIISTDNRCENSFQNKYSFLVLPLSFGLFFYRKINNGSVNLTKNWIEIKASEGNCVTFDLEQLAAKNKLITNAQKRNRLVISWKIWFCFGFRFGFFVCFAAVGRSTFTCCFSRPLIFGNVGKTLFIYCSPLEIKCTKHKLVLH